MPKIDKLCVRCGGWIRRSQRKYHCLCHRCIEVLTEAWMRGGIKEVNKIRGKRTRP